MLLAEKLLDTLYELEELTPSWKWDDNVFSDNPPRQIRYNMIVAMLKQLGYTTTPGNFKMHLLNRDIEEDEYLPSDVTDFLRPFGDFQRHYDIGDVCMTFLTLYNFRKRLHHALVDDLMVSGIGNVKPGNQIMAQVSERLLTDVSFVDQFLCIVVDPKGLKFDKDLLVKDYGYPKENLEEIDLDWI
jgi:hypothetical protein